MFVVLDEDENLVHCLSAFLACVVWKNWPLLMFTPQALDASDPSRGNDTTWQQHVLTLFDQCLGAYMNVYLLPAFIVIAYVVRLSLS